MTSADLSARFPCGSPLPDRAVPRWIVSAGLFLLLGFAINAVTIMALLSSTMVWQGLLHHDPDIAVSTAELMLALSPVVGVFGALVLTPIPAVTGAVVLALFTLVSGRLPLWATVVAIPLCIEASALQIYLSGAAVLDPSACRSPGPVCAGVLGVISRAGEGAEVPGAGQGMQVGLVPVHHPGHSGNRNSDCTLCLRQLEAVASGGVVVVVD